MHDDDESATLLCARCSCVLTPGKGNFYMVRIEAMADPTPPTFTEEDLARDRQQELEELYEQMRELSEREALDQVYRRMVLYLCGGCYRQWIENPTR